MKRFLRYGFLLFALCTLHFAFVPVCADDEQNWGVQPPSASVLSLRENSEKVWDREEDEFLYENYGSPDSPGFLNRENVDPATSEFEEKYDYEDDAPYNYDAGGN